MKIVIACIITILGFQVGLVTILTFIISLPLLPILKKINSKITWFVFEFVLEAMGGIAMIWSSIYLWKWLEIHPSILIPFLLAIPIIIWNWHRIKPQIGTSTQWDEVANGLGSLTGIIIGSIILI